MMGSKVSLTIQRYFSGFTTNVSLFSPRRTLYPPACRPDGLEAEPEATIPLFHGTGAKENSIKLPIVSYS